MKGGKLGINTLNERVMKKILVFLFLLIVSVSCYEDYIYDNVYSGVYFPFQYNVRTFVVGEGMKAEIGVVLGGVRENTVERNVNFELRGSLISPASLTMMQQSTYGHIKDYVDTITELKQLPSNYYNLSNSNTMVIETGQHTGTVTIRPDSVRFLADKATIISKYVLPFYITEADADSIIEPLRYAVIGFRYENMLFGRYWHGGSALVNRPGKADTTITYYTTIPSPDVKVWALETFAPDSLYANGFLDQVTGKKEMKLVLNGGTIAVVSSPSSTYEILPDGTSSFNRANLLQNRKIFLKYSYINTTNGFTYHCTDTLTFRTRMRDGINEWQDENPSHYE
jgi:hypothetical protein